MGVVKKYMNNQFNTRMFLLEHDSVSDFYTCSVQKSNSALPLLCIRLIIFLTCLATVVSSLVITGDYIDMKFWLIYLTHWGIVINMVCSGFAFFVSLVAYYHGSIDATSGLPWYVKAYWVTYNIAVPVALFITVFYWTFLATEDVDFSFDPVLDVFIHAVNSALMFCLVITARHPTHVLHFYHPLLATLVYLAFSIIYYYAGGTNPEGEQWIYPNIDWSDPGPTTVMVVASAFILLTVHLLVAMISLSRDWFRRRYIQNSRTVSIQP